MVIISFYILYKRWGLKVKGLYDARVVLFTKKGYSFMKYKDLLWII